MIHLVCYLLTLLLQLLAAAIAGAVKLFTQLLVNPIHVLAKVIRSLTVIAMLCYIGGIVFLKFALPKDFAHVNWWIFALAMLAGIAITSLMHYISERPSRKDRQAMLQQEQDTEERIQRAIDQRIRQREAYGLTEEDDGSDAEIKKTLELFAQYNRLAARQAMIEQQARDEQK